VSSSSLAHSTGQEATVGFYSEVVFPRLCDLLLGRSFVAKHRQQLLGAAHGDVLEIGFGTGLNLRHYPTRRVRRITTVDPNPGMHRLAQQRVRRSRIEVDQRVFSGERLPFEDNHFDCAVSTFTLCSIPNVNEAVGEVYRVLRPGGRFLFLEHGLSPEAKVQKWQRRLNWLEMRLADGCHLDRNIKALVAAQPFASVEVEEFYLERIPRTHGYLYRGAALK
jgi:ubiquinone/menaquinone biosynthesis C-methylase UbiE